LTDISPAESCRWVSLS